MPFHFKQFQLSDYAAAAMVDGCILAHDPGAGKSLALFVWPALRVGFEGMDLAGDVFGGARLSERAGASGCPPAFAPWPPSSS